MMKTNGRRNASLTDKPINSGREIVFSADVCYNEGAT